MSRYGGLEPCENEGQSGQRTLANSVCFHCRGRRSRTARLVYITGTDLYRPVRNICVGQVAKNKELEGITTAAESTNPYSLWDRQKTRIISGGPAEKKCRLFSRGGRN